MCKSTLCGCLTEFRFHEVHHQRIDSRNRIGNETRTYRLHLRCFDLQGKDFHEEDDGEYLHPAVLETLLQEDDLLFESRGVAPFRVGFVLDF